MIVKIILPVGETDIFNFLKINIPSVKIIYLCYEKK